MKFLSTVAITAAVSAGLVSAVPRPQAQSSASLDGSCTADASHQRVVNEALKNCMEAASNAAALVKDKNNTVATQKIKERFGVDPDDVLRDRISTQFTNIANACAGRLSTTFRCQSGSWCTSLNAIAYACLGCNQKGYVNMCDGMFNPNQPQIGCDGENNAAILVHEVSHNFGETDEDGAGKFQRLAMQLRPECINKPWPGGDRTDPLKDGSGQKAYSTPTPATLFDKNGPVQTRPAEPIESGSILFPDDPRIPPSNGGNTPPPPPSTPSGNVTTTPPATGGDDDDRIVFPNDRRM